jgi:hypothetical protein
MRRLVLFLSHHEAHEGHEDVRIYFLKLRALRVLFRKYDPWNRRNHFDPLRSPFFIFPRHRGLAQGVNGLPFSCSVGEQKLMNTLRGGRDGYLFAGTSSGRSVRSPHSFQEPM